MIRTPRLIPTQLQPTTPRFRLFPTLPTPLIAPTIGRTRGISPSMEPQDSIEYNSEPSAAEQVRHIEIRREGSQKQDSALRNLLREELRAVLGELGEQEKN